MSKLSIEDLAIEGKKVLMRVDFNVPLSGEGEILDPTRIVAALPSMRYVLEQGGALILMSHLGRPRYERVPELSLAPVGKALEELLERPVTLAPDCVGDRVELLADKLQPGEVLLLENLRFHRAEEHPEEDPDFAKTLASYADLYVNDAFGTAHRRHSSTTAVAAHFPNCAAAGFLLEKEIHFLGELMEKPERPFHALLGGAKVSTKMGVIKALLKKVDRLLIGGGMSYTFLKAEGVAVGNSLLEEELVSLAKEILEEHREKIVLPVDVVAATECSERATTKVVTMEEGIPEGHEGLDMGPQTVELFSKNLEKAKTILWNGPVGVFEMPPFAKGTEALGRVVGNSEAISIVGGGDSIAALNAAGLAQNITHISTGGGATLEYLEYGTLPAIESLSTKKFAV